MKELDILLTRYVDERYGAGPRRRSQQAFPSASWRPQDPVGFMPTCLGQEPPPCATLAALIERITANLAPPRTLKRRVRYR